MNNILLQNTIRFFVIFLFQPRITHTLLQKLIFLQTQQQAKKIYNIRKQKKRMKAEPKTQPAILNPLRIIGQNTTKPFCCIINESTIVYLSQRRLIIENKKTHQQTTLWMNPFTSQILSIIEVSCYNETKIAIALLDPQKGKYVIVILNIDWSGYMFHKDQHIMFNLHFLPHDYQFLQMEFSLTNNHLALLLHNNHHHVISLYQYISGCEECYVLLHDPVSLFKCIKYRTKPWYLYCSDGQLVMLERRSRTLAEEWRHPMVGMEEGETMLQLEYVESKKNDTFLFVLTSSGCFVVVKLNEDGLEPCCKLDVRLNPHNYIFYQGECWEEDAIMPLCFGFGSNRIVIGYKNCRKLTYISYSLLTYINYSLSITPHILYLPNEELQPLNDQMPPLTLTSIIKLIKISIDSCSCCLLVEDAQGKLCIQIIDTFSSLLADECNHCYYNEVFANYYCIGRIMECSYCLLNSTMFILHQPMVNEAFRLTCYCINYSQIVKITPNKLVCFSQVLKTKPFSLGIHPSAFYLFLLHDEVIKFHYYTRQKLYQSHYAINAKCEHGVFSPLGQKVIFAVQNKILVLNAYSLEVENVIMSNHVKKNIKMFRYCTGFDALVEFNSGFHYCLGMLENHSNLGLLKHHTLDFVQEERKLQQKHCELGSYVETTFEYDHKHETLLMIELGICIKMFNEAHRVSSTRNIDVSAVKLCTNIDLVMIGTMRGSLVIEKWPFTDQQVDNSFQIELHHHPVYAIQVTLNHRYLVTITKGGEIGICQFSPENTEIISKSSSLYLLKKWGIKISLVDNCLNSSQEGNKKNQKIAKQIGKEVYLSKKNQGKVKELQNQMEKKFEDDIMELERRVNWELENCEEEKRRKSINRKLERLRDELETISSSKNKGKQLEMEVHQKKLHDIFEERSDLETKLSFLILTNDEEKKKIKSEIHSQMKERLFLKNQQENQFMKNLKVIHKMQNKRDEINRRQEGELYQEKEQRSILIKQHYDGLLQELNQSQKKFKSEQRKLQGLILQYEEKQTHIRLNRMETVAQVDLLKSQKAQYLVNYNTLKNKVDEVESVNEKLIEKQRKQEMDFHQQKRLADSAGLKYTMLMKEVQALENSFRKLLDQLEHIDHEFYLQHRKKIQTNEIIDELKKKIVELKKERQVYKLKNVVVKTKNSAHHEVMTPVEPSKHFISSHLEQNKNYEDLLHKRHIITEKTTKMNKIRNQKLRNFKRNEKRLVNDCKRLVAQYNELKTFNDILVKKQTYLKQQIQKIELEEKRSKWKWRVSDGKPKLSKGMFISLHDDNKFITQH